MPGVHAKKSPSGAKRLHECSGALAYVDSLPEEMKSGAGAAARLGTASHALLEETGCVMLKPTAKLPKKPEERARTYEVDDDMILNVDLAFVYVESQCERLDMPMSRLQLETKTNPVPDRDDTTGTADITIDAWPELLEVVDYKNGRVTVEHEDNPQVLAYLAGRAHDTGWAHDTYQITVVQPNGRHEEGKVRSFEVSREALMAFVDKHRAAAERADLAADMFEANGGHVEGPASPDDDIIAPTWAETFLKAGPHCDDSFCEARLVCPVFKAWRKAQVPIDFDDAADTLPDPTLELAAEEALRIKRAAPYMLAMMKLANSFLFREAKEGRHHGTKFVRRRSYRRWKPGPDGEPRNGHEIAREMVEAGYISDNERAQLFTVPELITGPQAEKLIATKKLRDKFSGEFLHKPEGGLKLVLDTDPGEPVELSAASDFDDDTGDYDAE
jgi:hypothetical protein